MEGKATYGDFLFIFGRQLGRGGLFDGLLVDDRLDDVVAVNLEQTIRLSQNPRLNLPL